MQEMDDMTDEKLHPTINFLSPLILHWGVSQLLLGEGKFCLQRLSLPFHHTLNDWTTHIHTSWQQTTRKKSLQRRLGLQRINPKCIVIRISTCTTYCTYQICSNCNRQYLEYNLFTVCVNLEYIWQIGCLTTLEGYHLWGCWWLRLITSNFRRMQIRVKSKGWCNGSRKKRTNVLRGH